MPVQNAMSDGLGQLESSRMLQNHEVVCKIIERGFGGESQAFPRVILAIPKNRGFQKMEIQFVPQKIIACQLVLAKS